jgi:hypothetical protein
MTYKRIGRREEGLPRPDKSGIAMIEKDRFPLEFTLAKAGAGMT